MIRYEFAEDEQNAAESVEYQRPNENLMEFIGGEQNKHWEMDHQMNSYQTNMFVPLSGSHSNYENFASLPAESSISTIRQFDGYQKGVNNHALCLPDGQRILEDSYYDDDEPDEENANEEAQPREDENAGRNGQARQLDEYAEENHIGTEVVEAGHSNSFIDELLNTSTSVLIRVGSALENYDSDNQNQQTAVSDLNESAKNETGHDKAVGATEATNIFSNTKDAKFEAECLLRERMYDDEYGCHSKQFLVKIKPVWMSESEVAESFPSLLQEFTENQKQHEEFLAQLDASATSPLSPEKHISIYNCFKKVTDILQCKLCPSQVFFTSEASVDRLWEHMKRVHWRKSQSTSQTTTTTTTKRKSVQKSKENRDTKDLVEKPIAQPQLPGENPPQLSGNSRSGLTRSGRRVVKVTRFVDENNRSFKIEQQRQAKAKKLMGITQKGVAHKSHKREHSQSSKTSGSSGFGKYEEESDEEFEVEAILGKRIRGSQREYYVKWKGFDNSHNSWEPEENVYHLHVFHEYIFNDDNFEEENVRGTVNVGGMNVNLNYAYGAGITGRSAKDEPDFVPNAHRASTKRPNQLRYHVFDPRSAANQTRYQFQANSVASAFLGHSQLRAEQKPEITQKPELIDLTDDAEEMDVKDIVGCSTKELASLISNF